MIGESRRATPLVFIKIGFDEPLTRSEEPKVTTRSVPLRMKYFVDVSAAVSENNLLHRLETFLPTPHASRRPSYLESPGIKSKPLLSGCRKDLGKVLRLLTLRYLLDPQSKSGKSQKGSKFKYFSPWATKKILKNFPFKLDWIVCISDSLSFS